MTVVKKVLLNVIANAKFKQESKLKAAPTATKKTR